MSLPNGIVAMEFGRCPICPKSTVGSGVPLGINCGGCGHHFHIGTGDGSPLTGSKPIFCPRCEGACLGVEITEPPSYADPSKDEGAEEQLPAWYLSFAGAEGWRGGCFLRAPASAWPIPRGTPRQSP